MITRDTERDAYTMYERLKEKGIKPFECLSYCLYVLIEKYVSTQSERIRGFNIPYIEWAVDALHNAFIYAEQEGVFHDKYIYSLIYSISYDLSHLRKQTRHNTYILNPNSIAAQMLKGTKYEPKETK